MTVIAGLVDGEVLVMGADGRSTTGEGSSMETRDKLWTYHDGRMGMGSCGSGRLGQELRHEWEPPAFNGGDPDSYMRLVGRSIEDHLHSEARLWDIVADSDSPANLYGSIMVGLCGRLWWIGGDFCVIPWRGEFLSIGSGGAAAEASLYTSGQVVTAAPLEPTERIVLALEAAVIADAEIGPPFKLLVIPPW